MSVDVKNVLVGAPDQATTGAIISGAAVDDGSTLLSKDPADAVASGYISSDGLKLTPNRSTSDINDWSGASIRTVLESFNATLAWTEIEMSHAAMVHAFGADNVNGTTVSLDASMPPAQSWVFHMKDGNSKITVAAPNANVTAVDEIDFNASSAIGLPITITTHPDKNGKHVYIKVEVNGVTTASESH